MHIEHETITVAHYTLAFIGMVAHNGLEMQKVILEQKEFTINYYLGDPKNWVGWGLGTLSLVAIFLLPDQLFDAFGINVYNRLGCLIAGFFAHAFWSKLGSFTKKR